MMSVVGAAAGSPMELFRAKDAAEVHLRASGAPWTIVRSTAFVELWSEIMKRPPPFCTNVITAVFSAVVSRMLGSGSTKVLKFCRSVALEVP